MSNIDNNKPQKNNERKNGRDEMNLAEHSISTLSKVNKNIDSLKFHEEFKGKNGELIIRDWVVTASKEYGFPTSSVDDLIIALIEISKEANNFTNPRVPCGIYTILKKMNLPDTKQYYDMIKRDMDRLTGVYISAKNSFWDNKKKSYTTLGFHIIDSFHFEEKEKTGPKGKKYELMGYFFWNDIFFAESLQKGNLKFLDVNFYFNLKDPTTKRLFRLLDKRSFGRTPGKCKITFPFDILTYEKLGMSRKLTLWQAKYYLDTHAHKELRENSYLKTVEYDKKPPGWKITYTLIEREKKELDKELDVATSTNNVDVSNVDTNYDYQPTQSRIPNPKSLDQSPLKNGELCATQSPAHPVNSASDTRFNTLVNELVKRRVSKTTATDLCTNYPLDLIDYQIQHYDYLRETLNKDSKSYPKSASWLVSAIKAKDGGYLPPEDFKTKQEKEAEAQTNAIARSEAETERLKEEQRKQEYDRKVAQAVYNVRRKQYFNPEQYDTLWNNALNKLVEITQSSFPKGILSNSFIGKIEDSIIWLNAPNTFAIQHTAKHYQNHLLDILSDLTNTKILDIHYECETNSKT